MLRALPGRRALTLTAALATGLLGGVVVTPAAASAAETTTTFSGVVDADTATATPKTKVHTLQVTAGGSISASVDWASAGANLNLLLKGPSGATVASSYSKTAKPERITFTAPAAGTYKLNVVAATGGSEYDATATFPGDTAPPPPGGGTAKYDTSFGFNGPAGLYAYGMDWDPTSNTMLVGDYWNYRIKRFTTGGAKTTPHVVSVLKPADTPGGTTAPYDVEADLFDKVGGKASLWSADQGSSRIVQFTHDGRYLQTIGRGGGGTDAAHPGRAYPAGCGGGKMTIPTHIYADEGTGRLYVSDPMCRAVWMFSHDGDFLGQLDWSGSGIGFVIPRGLAEYGDEIYVVEFNQRAIAVFGKDGKWRRTIVRQSDMNDPRGLDIDQRNGDIVVVAAYKNEVFKFSKGGALLRKWGTVDGTATGPEFDAIRFPAVDGDGNIYVGETWGTRRADGSYTGYEVLKFSPTGQPLPFATGPDGPPDGGYNQQNGIAIDKRGKLHVVDTFEQRVQTFGTGSSCLSAANCPAWEGQFGSREAAGTNSKGFGYPRALGYSAEKDLIWVGDNNNAVLAWTPGGQFVHRFGSQGKSTGQFSGGVQGVEATGGRVYATDYQGCRLQIWDEDAILSATDVSKPGGAPQAVMGSCGSGPNQMTGPRGIAVGDASGNAGTVYVAETGTSRISRWNVAARTSQQIRPSCGGTGLKQPWGITWDPSRTWLYIGDVGNARIVRMTPDGSTCQVVTTGAGVPEGKLRGSNFLEFDAQGRLYASDNNRRVYRFTLSG